MDRLGTSLKQNQARLAALLHWPANIGIEMRTARLGAAGPEALLLWVDHLASDEQLRQLLEHLELYAGPPAPTEVARALPFPGQAWSQELDPVVQGVLNGHVALLAEGWASALLLDAAAPTQHDGGRMAQDPQVDIFGRDLRFNIGMIRTRIQDPAVRAIRVPVRGRSRGSVALVYLEGRARRSLVRLLRLWAGKHMGEEVAHRGIANPFASALGFLPRFDTTVWPDHAVLLLREGYILLVVDRAPTVYTAPVTAAAWLTVPNDTAFRYPLKRLLVRIRIILYLLVLLIPATVIALMNYHSDMIPTAFLAAITSFRENAPFGMIFEVLIMEGLLEIGREVAWRLPVAVPIGLVMITISLISLLAVHAGLIGPIASLAALLGGLISLALPHYSGTFLVRTWRLYLTFAAVIFGFFGLATVLMMLLTYLCMAKPWGIPFIGEGGWEHSSPLGRAPVGQRPQGGIRRWRSLG